MSIVSKIRNFKKWYQIVVKEHSGTKLSLYHTIRAMKYSMPKDFYRLYNLKENNPLDYINHYQRYLSRDINKHYIQLFDNKLIFEKVFGNYINIPKTIVTIFDNIYDSNGNLLDAKKLSELLVEDKYIVKPVAGIGGGIGIHQIKKLDNDKYEYCDKVISAEELFVELSKLDNYFISEFVKQHDYSNIINPYSVNTIRVITIKEHETGNFILPVAIHRFGSVKSKFVDNATSGGYVTNMDAETGKLLETINYDTGELFDIHPDSKAQINGVFVPNWDKVKSKLIETAKKFPYLPFIAWDVAITEDDFSVVEINASCGAALYQVFKPIKDTKLADFYKYYGYYK